MAGRTAGMRKHGSACEKLAGLNIERHPVHFPLSSLKQVPAGRRPLAGLVADLILG
jgi:hypothetical protein